MIDSWIYGQDGKRITLQLRDDADGREFAEWLRIHDRYVTGSEVTADYERAQA